MVITIQIRIWDNGVISPGLLIKLSYILSLGHSMHVFFSYLAVVLFFSHLHWLNIFSVPLHSLTIKITKYEIRCKAKFGKNIKIIIN